MQPRKLFRLNPDTLVLLKQIFFGFLAIAAVSLLITAVWYGTRMKSLTLQSVQITGGETISHVEVERLVREKLEGEYVGLVPKVFAWTYPKSEVIENLESIKRMHNIVVERTSGTELQVSFDEYQPYALWCSEGTEFCAFVDKTGYAFSEAPQLTGGSFMRFVKMGSEYELLTTLIDEAAFQKLLEEADLLAEHGWYISRIDVDSVGDAFLQVVGGGELKITLSQSPETMVDNLLTVISSDDFSHLTPGNFQYIDLRFGNKVFVNEEIAAPEEDATMITASSSEEQ